MVHLSHHAVAQQASRYRLEVGHARLGIPDGRKVERSQSRKARDLAHMVSRSEQLGEGEGLPVPQGRQRVASPLDDVDQIFAGVR